MNKVAAFALRRKNSILSMSEKMFCPPQPLRLVWITPAYAGKSSRNETCWHRPWDHPCVCGEKVPITCVPKYALGSPPRVRGKALVFERERTEHRIIPACAGKRPRPRRWVRPPRDHPRVCGEKTTTRSIHSRGTGSPPRVRGKVSAGKILLHDGGITPACAGKRPQIAGHS